MLLVTRWWSQTIAYSLKVRATGVSKLDIFGLFRMSLAGESRHPTLALNLLIEAACLPKRLSFLLTFKLDLTSPRIGVPDQTQHSRPTQRNCLLRFAMLQAAHSSSTSVITAPSRIAHCKQTFQAGHFNHMPYRSMASASSVKLLTVHSSGPISNRISASSVLAVCTSRASQRDTASVRRSVWRTTEGLRRRLGNGEIVLVKDAAAAHAAGEFDAETIHSVNVATLNDEFCTTVTTEEAISQLSY